jgi:hypothetical protein
MRHLVVVWNKPLLTELDLFWNGILQRFRPGRGWIDRQRETDGDDF